MDYKCFQFGSPSICASKYHFHSCPYHPYREKKEMSIIVTLQIDLAKANPELIEEYGLDEKSDAELLEWVADFFGDSAGDTLLQDQFLPCFDGVINVERKRDSSLGSE